VADAKSRVVIVTSPDRTHSDPIRWERIGEVITELSHLYQVVRERHIDLILADESRTDLVRSVGTRVRRFNPLTDIWRVVDSNHIGHDEPGYIDGIISRELGQQGVEHKIAAILHVKNLLEQYGIVGRSAKIKVVAETIERIAPTEVPVLIVGPSGSGKELVSRAVHDHSPRRDRPFVAINCGALAEGVLESELFGHEKGAFTGSVGKREGLFSKADRGTIFLDEISETRGDLQVKLLRVLEDGTYYPVGSSVAQKVDVRVVSATNRDLTEAIADRSFREDLYYRIGVVKITLPPLLDRKNDIQPLLTHFWRHHSGMDYSDGALDLLMKYDWPGNVRQLRNFADRMVALKGGHGLVETEDVERFIEEQHMVASNLPVSTGRTVEEAGQELIYRAIMQLGNEVRLLRELILAHLPPEAPAEQAASSPHPSESPRSMEQMEQQLIEKVLDETSGNRKEAARRLGIGERTLYRKIKKYGLR
jgi:transcriptional regulator with PAS, ATPase and Fis domain